MILPEGSREVVDLGLAIATLLLFAATIGLLLFQRRQARRERLEGQLKRAELKQQLALTVRNIDETAFVAYLVGVKQYEEQIDWIRRLDRVLDYRKDKDGVVEADMKSVLQSLNNPGSYQQQQAQERFQFFKEKVQVPLRDKFFQWRQDYLKALADIEASYPRRRSWRSK